MRKFLAVLILGSISACGGTSMSMGSGGGLSSGGGNGRPVTSNQDQTFGKILNNVRIGNGAKTVTYDSRLDAAAQGHADDMLARGYTAHKSPEGDEVEDRIKAQGYNPSAWGENLAKGYGSEGEALKGWENSPAHDRMMNANTLEEFGLGVSGSGGNTRWVLVMATES